MLGILNYNDKTCKKYLFWENFKKKQRTVKIKIKNCVYTLSIGCMDPWVGWDISFCPRITVPSYTSVTCNKENFKL